MRRFKSSRFTLNPNKNLDYTKYVDTASFYITVHSKDEIEKYDLKDFITGYKFYGNGRVGFFKNVDFEKVETFNPQKADMCFYNYSENSFFIESLYHTPGGKHYLSKDSIVNVINDTLIISRVKNRRLPTDTTMFKRRLLPTEFLIYKPDW